MSIIIDDWLCRYFLPEDRPAAIVILSRYGFESWHRERERVWRDAIIISCGSLEKLGSIIKLAMIDYRDILISEEIDPWVISELKKHEI